MNKYKYLMKNMGVLTLSQIGTKILCILFIPIYTGVLTTSEYGIYDYVMALVSLSIPIFTLNISEAELRFSLETDNKEAIFKACFKVLLKGYFLFLLMLVLNYITGVSEFVKDNSAIILVIFVMESITQMVSFYARGIEKIKEIAIAGVISTIVLLGTNILFLLVFKWGLIGYFASYITSLLSQLLYLTCITNAFSSIIKPTKYNVNEKELLKYSIPLLFGTIGWWMNNYLDRLIVVSFCGIAVNGLYSMAGKIPAIINNFQSVFNQVWILSAVKEHGSDNQDEFYASVLKIYDTFMVILCSVIIISTKLISRILFSNDFYQAWVYVPFLCISTVFGAASGYLGGIFSTLKKTSIIAVSTLLGALINVVLNLVLVKPFGALGAAFATMISFYVIYLIRHIWIRKFNIAKISTISNHICYAILLIQACLIIKLDNLILMYVISGVLLFVLFVIKRKVLIMIYKRIRHKKAYNS